MPSCRLHIARASAGRSRPSTSDSGASRKSFPYACPFTIEMPFGISYTSQNASRCQPNRLVSERGIALNSPTKNVL